MLNEVLVNEFRRIYDQQLSGALVLKFAEHDSGEGLTERQLQFYFEDGNLRILDFAEHKEILLLRQYRRYHKVGVEIQAMVEQLYASSGVSVSDYLFQQQLVTEEEIGQVTRTLVEDVLCDSFGQEHQQLLFNQQAQVDDYDLDLTAVKLRIDVAVLLEMVEARVAERDAVQVEIESFDHPYSLVEGAPESIHLNEQELNVLHFVDGRQSVNSIAQAMRDSSLNVACYMTSLSQQGFVEVKQTSGVVSRLRPSVEEEQAGPSSDTDIAAQPQQSVAHQVPPQPATVPLGDTTTDVAAAATAVMAEPRKRTIVEGPRSKFPVVLLTVILLIALGVLYLVNEATNRQEAIVDSSNKLRDAVRQANWSAANQLALEAFEQAGSDTVIQREVEQLLTQLNGQDFAERLNQFESVLTEKDLTESERILLTLPRSNQVADLWTADLRDRLKNLKRQYQALREEFNQLEQQLRNQVNGLLAQEKVSEAMALFDEHTELVHDAATEVLLDWRRSQFDRADDSSLNFDQRRHHISLLQQSRLNEAQMSDLNRIVSDIDQSIVRLNGKVNDLTALNEQGDYIAVLERLEPIKQSVQGGELEPKVAELEVSAKQMAQQSQQLTEQSLVVLGSGSNVAQFNKILEQLNERLASFPDLSDRQQLAGLGRALEKSRAKCYGAKFC